MSGALAMPIKKAKQQRRFAAQAAELERLRALHAQSAASSPQPVDKNEAWLAFLKANPSFVDNNSDLFRFTPAQLLRYQRRAKALKNSQNASKASRSRPSKTAGLTPESSLAVPDSAPNTGSRSVSCPTGSGSLKRGHTAPIVRLGLALPATASLAGRPQDPLGADALPWEPRTK
jgi:hypothetical protein